MKAEKTLMQLSYQVKYTVHAHRVSGDKESFLPPSFTDLAYADALII